MMAGRFRPGEVMQVVVLSVALLMVAVSCGTGGLETTETFQPEAIVSTSTSTSATTTPPVVTVPTNGWVQVGGQTFNLLFTCYAPGVGDVAAIGVGEHPDSGEWIEALIQGFLGQPYVGVRVGESTRYEAVLDEPLNVYVRDDTISVGAIRWERDLDLASGVGEPAGYGTVLVACTDYEAELPEGY